LGYPETLDICAEIGTTPSWQSGSGTITNRQACGCCTSPCISWTLHITGLGASVDVAWIDCKGSFQTQTFFSDQIICAQNGSVPIIEGGSGTIEFYGCDCA
jgi:hypothetical protein